ncbi:MAG: c-type cytochrome [Hyphomonadaceae bacterium]
MIGMGLSRAAFILALALAACSQPQQAADADLPPSPKSGDEADMIAQGREIADRECARCHALASGEESPHPEAPPMSELLGRYSADALNEDLIDGIKLGHEDMPQFDFDIATADALIAYLKSIRIMSSPE